MYLLLFLFILVTLLLACNKMDKNSGIDKRPIEDYARSIHARVFYTSAKTGEGVDSLFTEMATSIISRKRSDAASAASYASSFSNPSVSATEAPVEEKKGCCCYFCLEQTCYCTGGTEMSIYSWRVINDSRLSRVTC